jgi:hypothetical protein
LECSELLNVLGESAMWGELIPCLMATSQQSV